MSEKQKILKAMYRGELPIGDLNLKCAVLDDETRILSTKSIFEAFGRSKRGLDKARNEEILATLSKIIPNHGWAQVPPFLGSKSLISLIDTDLFNVLQPVQYYDGETLMQGYRAELLPQLCNLYLKGRRQGILTSEQKRIKRNNICIPKSVNLCRNSFLSSSLCFAFSSLILSFI